MTQFVRLTTIIMSGCLFLQGCQSLKTTMGIERKPPDEFAVLPSSQPLDMPPNFRVLPVPQPGAPRPQDVKSKKKFFGTKTGHSSPGQQALLKMGGADKKQEDIRNKIEEEHHQQASKTRNLILETLHIKQPNKDVIDPLEEATQLKEQGIPQQPQKSE